jgi:hypothetical protein
MKAGKLPWQLSSRSVQTGIKNFTDILLCFGGEPSKKEDGIQHEGQKAKAFDSVSIG